MSLLEQQAELLSNNVSGWETSVLKRLGERINQCGKMSIADIQSFNNIAVVKQDMRAITKDLATITGLNASQIEKMYSDALEAEHLANKPLYDYRNMKFTSIEENRELKAIVKAYSRTTAEEMVNLSKTSVLKMIDETGKVQPFEKVYKNTIDKAVMQVASGSTDFHTAMKDTIRALGGNGIRVQYESGLTRRLDSAVRQNILWGAKQASIEYNDLIGQELGCDGIEIDWHSFPRPSHEFMQGKQYVLGEARTINGEYFESADEALERLEDYNCYHYKTPIICGISEPRYSKEELDKLNEQNKQIFEIDGKEYTGYEASQSMRKLETAIREQKSIKQMAKASGNKGLMRECDENIMHYRSKYSQISDVTGIKEDVNRLTIVNKPKKLSDAVDVPKTIEQVNKRGTKGIEKIVNDRIDSQRLNLIKPKNISKSGINPYSVDLTGIKTKNADTIVDTVEELSGKYKTTIQGYRTAKKGEFLGRSGTFATTEYNSTTASSDIVFNKGKVDDIDRIKELSQKGWSVKVKEGLEDRYIATHEFAHTVVPNTTIPLKNYVGYDIKPQQSARRELNSLFGEYKEKVQGLQREYKQTEFDYIMGDVYAGEKARALKTQLDSIKISDYSLENVDEFMAEAFTSHEIGIVHTEYEKRVMDIIIKYFRK